MMISVKVLLPLTALSVVAGSVAAPREESVPVLERRVHDLTLPEGPFHEVLEAFRGVDRRRLVVGFEKAVTEVVDSDAILPSMRFRDATVREVLDAMVSSDIRYQYEQTSDGAIVNIHPAASTTDPEHLLNARLQGFHVEGRCFPSTIILSPSRYIDELRIHIDKRQREYLRRTGRLGGSAGSILRDTVEGPYLSIHSDARTVREALNAVVLYTVQHRERLGWEFPLSWKYEFIPDVNATNGLGGTPHWNVF